MSSLLSPPLHLSLPFSHTPTFDSIDLLVHVAQHLLLLPQRLLGGLEPGLRLLLLGERLGDRRAHLLEGRLPGLNLRPLRGEEDIAVGV